MKTSLTTLAALSLLLIGGIAHAQTPTAAPPLLAPKTDIAYLPAQLDEYLTRFEVGLTRPGASPSVRNLPNGALTVLVLGKDPARAQALLRRLFAAQDMNPGSPSFGSVPWLLNDTSINDPNADEFSSQAIAPILDLYGDKLSPAFKAEMTPHIRAFFVALKRRQMRTPAYTNIFLMRAVNMLLMGEAIGDMGATAQGYRWLDEWTAYTAATGIHEFDSPTYTAVDLNSLYLGYRLARRPGAREQFKAALDLFWADCAANYFAGRGGLSGPHSRDYDFVGGWGGGMGYYYAANGLPDDGTSNMLDFERVYPVLNTQPGNYRPDARLLALARLPERVIRSRWGEGTLDRYNYVTPDFAIGGATGDYGGQDKLITVEFASRKKLPAICVTPETDDAPYGHVKTKDRTGHSKANHLPLGPTCVQDKGTLLALLDVSLAKAGTTETVATNVLLPAFADTITLDGKPVRADKPFEISARVGSVVGVREGRSGVAIRLFAADGVGGDSVGVVLKTDTDGLQYGGAARLVVYHYKGAARKWGNESFKVGILMVATPCTDDAALAALVRRVGTAPVTQKDGPTWEVSATVGETTLTAARDTVKHKVVARRVKGVDLPAFPILSVNGMEYGASLRSTPLPTPRAPALPLRGPQADLAFETSDTIRRSLYRDVPHIGLDMLPSGAYGPVNTAYEKAGNTGKWWIEEQRTGRDAVLGGIATHDPAAIERGLKMFDWGWSKQQPDGSFDCPDKFHSTAFFVDGVAHALLDLSASPYGPRYADRIAAMRPKVLLSARWMARPENDHAIIGKYTHRYYLVAAALGEAGILCHDPALVAKSKMYIRQGLALQAPEGYNPEKGGWDLSYNAVGLLLAIRYSTLVAPPDLENPLRHMIERNIAWQAGRIRPDGTIDTTGSTRTGNAHPENTRAGKPKDVSWGQITRTFAYWSLLTGDLRWNNLALQVARAAGRLVDPAKPAGT